MEEKMGRQAFAEEMRAAEGYGAWAACLRRYLLQRLGLPADTKEESLSLLVVYSAKLRLPGIDDKRLEEKLATIDCHQTSYVVGKKNLLMLEVEGALGVTLPDAQLARVETVDDYARALWAASGRESGVDEQAGEA